MTKKPMLVALAHECVHVRQYARMELRQLADGKMRWKGVDYDESAMSTDDYWLLPWECEARGLELGLYYHYLNWERNRG
jgi:hypothetical protein